MAQSSTNPTMRQLADSLSSIDQRTEELLASLEGLHSASSDEFTKVWVALGGIAGLDGLAVGLAQIAEVMGPMRGLNPPTTHLELQDGVADALGRVRGALGGTRDSNFQHLSTAFELPVSFIGEAVPSGWSGTGTHTAPAYRAYNRAANGVRPGDPRVARASGPSSRQPVFEPREPGGPFDAAGSSGAPELDEAFVVTTGPTVVEAESVYVMQVHTGEEDAVANAFGADEFDGDTFDGKSYDGDETEEQGQ